MSEDEEEAPRYPHVWRGPVNLSGPVGIEELRETSASQLPEPAHIDNALGRPEGKLLG